MVTRVFVWGAVVVSCAACSKADPPPASLRASTSASAAKPTAVACQAQPASYSIGPASEKGAGDDEDLGAPFGVEIGGASALSSGFAVAASTLERSEHHAIVAIVEDDGRGRTVDLGQVHGDVTPPLLVARGDRIFAGVVDSDASASVLRIVRIDTASGKPAQTVGPDVARREGDSPVYALAVGAERGVVVWDDWDEKAEHGVIRLASFAPDDLSRVNDPVQISKAETDAESPRVIERAEGFWAAWIVNGRVERSDRKRKPRSEDDEALSEDLGPRWIILNPLDRAGNPQGRPVTVSPPEGHALSFDLATAADGGALIVWRDDSTSRAAAGGIVRLALVRADGSVDKRVLAEDDVGSTVPTLLPDEISPGAPQRRWVAFAADDETTRFGVLDARGQPLRAPESEPSMLGAEPLAARAGKIFTAKPKGKRAEFCVVTCKGPW